MDVDNGNINSGHEERTRQAKLYQKRKEKAAEAWSYIRFSLIRRAVELWALPNDPRCYLCGTSDVAVRCLDCAAEVYYCEQCCNTLHKSINIFHRLYKWKVNIMILVYYI